MVVSWLFWMFKLLNTGEFKRIEFRLLSFTETALILGVVVRFSSVSALLCAVNKCNSGQLETVSDVRLLL